MGLYQTLSSYILCGDGDLWATLRHSYELWTMDDDYQRPENKY